MSADHSGCLPLHRRLLEGNGWKPLYAYNRATDSFVLMRGARSTQLASRQRPRLTPAQARAELNALKRRGERQCLTPAQARAEVNALKRRNKRRPLTAAQARAELNALKSAG